MFLLVGWYIGWLVGWFVQLSRINGKADQDGLHVKRTVPATEWTSRGLFPDRATSRGIKGARSSLCKFKYLSDTSDFDEIWIIGTKHHIRELLKISDSFSNCKPPNRGLNPLISYFFFYQNRSRDFHENLIMDSRHDNEIDEILTICISN